MSETLEGWVDVPSALEQLCSVIESAGDGSHVQLISCDGEGHTLRIYCADIADLKVLAREHRNGWAEPIVNRFDQEKFIK